MLLCSKTENACSIFCHKRAQGIRQQTQVIGDGWKVAPIPAEVFNVNPHDSAWVNVQCTSQSLASFEERIRLGSGLARIQDVTHILATGWEGSAIPASHERADRKGWKTRMTPAGMTLCSIFPMN
jgi:hypothetical protein